MELRHALAGIFSLNLVLALAACPPIADTDTSVGTTGDATNATDGTGGTTGESTTDAPTSGMTEGMTGGSTTGEPTTGDPTEGTTGGSEIADDCAADNAAQAEVDAFTCGCAVELGDYPDLQSCLDENTQSPELAACSCMVIATHPENAETAKCQAENAVAFAACLTALTCMDEMDQAACYGDYYAGLEGCPEFTDETFSELELQCSGEPPFLCGSGEQIPLSWQCDDEPDCMDGSDELDCIFTCDDGQEIPTPYKCDGEPDCMDGSDEKSCP